MEICQVQVAGCFSRSSWVSRRRSEISVAPRRPVAVILMVSRSRPGTILETAPSGLVALCKVLSRSIGISQVAGNKYRAGYFLDQFRCGVSPRKIGAARPICCSQKDGIIRSCTSRGGRLSLSACHGNRDQNQNRENDGYTVLIGPHELVCSGRISNFGTL